MPAAPRHEALVVASHGQRLLVQTRQGAVLSCVVRRRLDSVVCGDRVEVALTAPGAGVIEALHARSSLIYRSDARREKPIAANVTQVVVVVATLPQPNAELVDRCLAAAEHASVKALLVQNKIDLDGARELHAHLAARYAALGYRLCALSAHESAAPLQARLRGERSLVIGQSGVGKSTLVNALVPAAQARTGAISRFDSGRHTTTHTQLYRLDNETLLIDSPGMHRFGLQHIAPAALAACFVEFRPFVGHCRFNDCRHRDEPGCALHAALERNEVSAERVRSYRQILATLAAQRSAAGRAEPARQRQQQDDEEP